MYQLHKIVSSAGRGSLVLGLFALLISCATPVTRQQEISYGEVAAEQRVHVEEYQKSKQQRGKQQPQQPTVETHGQQRKNANFARLEKIMPRLDRAMQPLCPSYPKPCHYIAYYDDVNNEINASATGNKLYITHGIINFFAQDNELAFIMAHELAHNLMGHIQKKQQNIILGVLIDLGVAVAGGQSPNAADIAAQAYSQEFEAEADYVGVYILARAGYDINNIPNIWRKMSAQDPRGINNTYFATHPSNPERTVRLQKAVAEIKRKQSSGQALLPNFLQK